MEPIINAKKDRLKLTPEQLFNLYLECNAPGAPVKMILERYGLRPWDLIAIRKKVKAAAMEALAHPGKQGRNKGDGSIFLPSAACPWSLSCFLCQITAGFE